MIEIMNLKSGRMTEKFDMKIDRSSPVGNPTEIDQLHDRNAVCEMFDMDFGRQMENPYFEAYVQSLVRIYTRHGRLRLWCWCAPKRCHGETIKAFIERQVQK
jgi:hypothetical protein